MSLQRPTTNGPKYLNNNYVQFESKDICPRGYERVYLPLYKVADTPFHTQGNDMLNLKFY